MTPCDATLGQRRVAALLDLVCGADTGVAAGSRTGRSTESGAADARSCGAEISIVMTLDEFLQGTGVVGELLEDPQAAADPPPPHHRPADGPALDLGRRRYEVSEPLRRWIVARDRTCRFPGCSRRASACQIDHVDAWSDEGGTDASNLHALCTRHHQLKTHGGLAGEPGGCDRPDRLDLADGPHLLGGSRAGGPARATACAAAATTTAGPTAPVRADRRPAASVLTSHDAHHPPIPDRLDGCWCRGWRHRVRSA